VLKAVIIYNPMARNAPNRERLLTAGAALRDHGWQVDLTATQTAGHAPQLAHDAAVSGADVVFACGGDGTINEVVNGLAGSETALAVMRGGMGNVFAKEVGVKREPEAALRVLLDGERRRFDLGIAGQRYFLLMAGIGFDAAIVKKVPSTLKRTLGSTSYAIYGLREVARYESRQTSLKLDGKGWHGELFWALLGNTRSYGGVLNVTHRALVDDGLLDAYVFAGRGLRWIAWTALRIAAKRHDAAAGVSFQRLRSLEVETPGLPVQTDGEFVGKTPMRFSVAPQALDVLAPKGKLGRLFGRTADASNRPGRVAQ
jgi:YegS/Rv2252/BmrU family lipid kinase